MCIFLSLISEISSISFVPFELFISDLKPKLKNGYAVKSELPVLKLCTCSAKTFFPSSRSEIYSEISFSHGY